MSKSFLSFVKPLFILLFLGISLNSLSQCPTVLTPSIVTNSGGQVSILPVFDVVPTSGSLVLWMTSGSTSYTASATSMTNVITQTNVATGTYSVCLSANYLNSGCASVTGCVQIAVVGPTLCPTVLTPSIITNSGGQVWLKPVFDVVPASGVLTLWMNSGLNSYTTTTTSMTNLIANTNLAAGNYSLCLTASSLNSGCPSVTGCIYQVTVAASNPCPTVLTPSIIPNVGGQASILPVFDVVPSSGIITSSLTDGTNSYSLTSTSMTNIITHTNVAAGNYSVCLTASSLNSGCASVTGCDQVIVFPVQCPTQILPNYTYHPTGRLVVRPFFMNGVPYSGKITSWLTGTSGSYSLSTTNMNDSLIFNSVSAGNYTLCVKADSLSSGCASLTGCANIVLSAPLCPTVLTPSVTYNSGGQVSILPVFDVVPTSGVITQWMTSGLTSYTAGATSMTNVITHTNVAAGIYSVCLQASSLNSGCASLTGCVQITVAASNPCPTFLTPSIVTNSGGQVSILPVFDVVPSSGLITSSMIDGTNSYSLSSTSMTNAITHYSVTAGNYNVCLTAGSLNLGCPSVSGCGQVFVSPVCQPGFTYSTDVNCVTHFINTSTGASLTHHWQINGMTYTTTDVSVSLPDGSYQVQLINNTMTGSSSFISCDTLNQTVSVLCPSVSTCSAIASFSVSPDPATPGHYFVYDISTATGTRSYLWDFGDGTTSTQQHPVHQYATPGQYVICLTISGTSGTVTCSSTRCDSSSVRRVASGFFMSQVTVLPGGPTSVKEKDATEHLNVYPNPVSESLTLDLGTLDQTLHYALSDIYGRMVIEGEITGSKTRINTSLLPNGFYILNIINATGDSLKTVKIVK